MGNDHNKGLPLLSRTTPSGEACSLPFLVHQGIYTQQDTIAFCWCAELAISSRPPQVFCIPGFTNVPATSMGVTLWLLPAFAPATRRQ